MKELLAGTEFAVQPEAPRQEHLPVGWHIVGYDVAKDYWYMGGDWIGWSVCLRFAHDTGPTAEIEWRASTLPLDYGWLSGWLTATERMPTDVAARSEGPRRLW